MVRVGGRGAGAKDGGDGSGGGGDGNGGGGGGSDDGGGELGKLVTVGMVAAVACAFVLPLVHVATTLTIRSLNDSHSTVLTCGAHTDGGNPRMCSPAATDLARV